MRETKVAQALLGTASPSTGAVSSLPRLGFALDKYLSGEPWYPYTCAHLVFLDALAFLGCPQSL